MCMNIWLTSLRSLPPSWLFPISVLCIVASCVQFATFSFQILCPRGGPEKVKPPQPPAGASSSSASASPSPSESASVSASAFASALGCPVPRTPSPSHTSCFHFRQLQLTLLNLTSFVLHFHLHIQREIFRRVAVGFPTLAQAMTHLYMDKRKMSQREVNLLCCNACQLRRV